MGGGGEGVGDRFIPARAGNTRTAPPPAPPPAVHPRSRGEHAKNLRLKGDPIGSSPLARGTQSTASQARLPRRFIPARAGNTFCRCPGSSPGPVHPRSRGEHQIVGESAHQGLGSSPLARGTRSRAAGLAPRPRFIPARAGNTGTGRRRAGAGAVHPRSRGEHRRATLDAVQWYGSSPLARGTLQRDHAARPARRFIPARAGNTPASRRACPGTPVHPRSRGEHDGQPFMRAPENGSSPLARGTLRVVRLRLQVLRFIPARAGNTCSASDLAPLQPVHPRSRGEHERARDEGAPQIGSSPLARGTPFRGWPQRQRPRFIPARAGNTACAAPRYATPPVHPRSRGEHLTPDPERPHAVGSSPLARGTHVPAPCRRAPVRFIPARAGNTSQPRK